MDTDQSKKFEQINKLHEKLASVTNEYWLAYSNINTWQFWVLLLMLFLPLAALYFFIDRKKILLIGFFGLNIHIWFNYIDTFGITHRLFNYPHQIIPFLPTSVALDTSLIPVTFMLLFQWTLLHNKNFYVFATAYSAFLSFLFKPALVTFGLFQLYKGMNYFYIFLMYILIFLLSKWITNLFLYLQKNGETPLEHLKVTRLFSIRKKAR